MQFFWVNLGITHKEVKNGNFLWAPKSSVKKSGKEVFLEHWSNVSKVKAGDVIFCCHDQQIDQVALAIGDAYEAGRPESRSFTEWGSMGYRVDVELTDLARPILRDQVAAAFVETFDSHCRPSLFTIKATLTQIYMSAIPANAGVFLLETAGQINKYENLMIANGSNKKVSNTVRKALIQARIGQGRFRTSLIERWRGNCALTGLDNPGLLVASHIQPWSLADNAARLDPDNGFLLAAHIDRLFDRGLISFSDKLDARARNIFSLEKFPGIDRLTKGNRHYLAMHRDLFGFA
ncbi:hypothetical protein D3C75_741370 [compost metagenome]